MIIKRKAKKEKVQQIVDSLSLRSQKAKRKKKKDGEDFESRSVEHWCFLGNPDLVHHMR